jgi:hypothetical protein
MVYNPREKHFFIVGLPFVLSIEFDESKSIAEQMDNNYDVFVKLVQGEIVLRADPPKHNMFEDENYDPSTSHNSFANYSVSANNEMFASINVGKNLYVNNLLIAADDPHYVNIMHAISRHGGCISRELIPSIVSACSRVLI